MRAERLNSLLLGEIESPSIVCPDYRYDSIELKEVQDGEGAALIILRNPSDPQILLGLHNSRDSEKNGKWSFFGETRKSGEETGLATLSRGLAEELNWDLNDHGLELSTYDQDKLFYLVYKLPRRSQYYPGQKSFTVGVYTLWSDEDCSGFVGSNEVIRTEYFSLQDVLKQQAKWDGVGLDYREFTLPTLRELAAGGTFDANGGLPRPVRFPL